MPGEEQTLLKVSLPPPLAPAWQALWLESGREGWLLVGGRSYLAAECLLASEVLAAPPDLTHTLPAPKGC